MKGTRIFNKLRRGVSVVEVAVTLPLVILMAFGVVEFGRGMMVKHSLEESARAGCRVAVLSDTTTQDVKNIVASSMSIANITDYTVTINPTPLTGVAKMSEVSVTVSVPFDKVAYASGSFLQGKTLTGSCVMSAEEKSDTAKKAKKSKSKSKKKKG